MQLTPQIKQSRWVYPFDCCFYSSILLISCVWMLTATVVQAAIVDKEVSYQVGDTKLEGYLVYDDSIKGKRPGVLVVHEWWGHNDYARKRARMLAKLGYIAMALDMYGDGKQASHPDDAQKFSSEITNNMELGKQRFKAAMKVLQQNKMTDSAHIAAIGYCFGGAVVLHMARLGVDLDAVVSFHGSLATSKPAQPGAVKTKVMVAHGGADPFVKLEQVTAFINEMNQAGVFYRMHVYSGAKHAFTNPDADEYGAKFRIPLQYNADADRESWGEMQLFLERAFKN